MEIQNFDSSNNTNSSTNMLQTRESLVHAWKTIDSDDFTVDFQEDILQLDQDTTSTFTDTGDGTAAVAGAVAGIAASRSCTPVVPCGHRRAAVALAALELVS